ncbi:zinc finger protein 500-like [Frankliniella occidentalis]|uniref:Zinc finger protein 500-like n=1 Tax=Frankliniella occidentalis TaxID=133901 RepID=A0A9C6XVJ5_FRAOC|nr:zinc finger protein 500-like [Frankliniella occidentalis]
MAAQEAVGANRDAQVKPWAWSSQLPLPGPGPLPVLPAAGLLGPAVLGPGPGPGPGSLSPSSVFTCPNCGKGYSYKGNLNRHIRVECGKEPQLSCPVCFKMFKHKSNMEMHIERVHTNHKYGEGSSAPL